jgi:TPR repeat protein
MSQQEKDTAAANKLFVEAVQLVKTAEEEGLTKHRRPHMAEALEEALAKLNEIFEDYPSTDLAVKLISGQHIGAISLEDVRSAALSAGAKATEKAAEQGDEDAQFYLGHMYLLGKGAPKDKAEAFKWWQKAAEQGHADAQYELARMYYEGYGVPWNDATPSDGDREAIKWWRKAAEQDHTKAKAQHNLGVMYLNGQGVPEDKAEAIKWFRMAAEQGHEEAKRGLEILEAK